jgi:hypothetical protein
MSDTSPPSLAIEQINLTYDMWQDRLVLRLRTRDSSLVELLLTRRLTQNLLPALVKLVGGTVLAPDPAALQELLAYEHRETVGASDFAQPFNEDGQSLFEGNPMLVSEVKLHVLADNQGWRLDFLDRECRGMNINADKNMLHNIIKLFNSILPSTGWALPSARIECVMVSAGRVTH